MRVKAADAPSHQTLRNVELTAQPGLKRVRNDLLQVGIPDQSIVDKARPNRIRAGQFQWSRRAVRLGEVAIKGQVWRQLIGRPDHGIEMGVGVIAGERWVIAEFVRQIDLGEVEAAAGSDRQT